MDKIFYTKMVQIEDILRTSIGENDVVHCAKILIINTVPSGTSPVQKNVVPSSRCARRKNSVNSGGFYGL